MAAPYRIVVWGPGGLGSTSVAEVLQSPGFKLVGLRVYSEHKAGVDAATLFGLPPCGVLTTADAAEALAIDCDCILYTARDYGNYNNDDEILQILAAGRNVVTALPYQHAHLVRDPAFMARLDAACRQGGSVFHATGVDPDVISDRLAVAATGFCNDVSSMKLQENWDFNYTPADTLALCGFGKTVEEARQMPVAGIIADNFLKQVCLAMGEALDVEFARVENEHEYVLAPQDITTATTSIKAGTVGRVTHRWSGYTAERPERPFFTIEVNWVMGDSMLPPGVEPNQYWVVTIEGRPSVKLVVDLKASMETQQRFLMIGDTPSEPGYHAVVASMLQAIPRICSAKPGYLPIARQAIHWKKSKLA